MRRQHLNSRHSWMQRKTDGGSVASCGSFSLSVSRAAGVMLQMTPGQHDFVSSRGHGKIGLPPVFFGELALKWLHSVTINVTCLAQDV